jgi:hypothetical protein
MAAAFWVCPIKGRLRCPVPGLTAPTTDVDDHSYVTHLDGPVALCNGVDLLLHTVVGHAIDAALMSSTDDLRHLHSHAGRCCDVSGPEEATADALTSHWLSSTQRQRCSEPLQPASLCREVVVELQWWAGCGRVTATSHCKIHVFTVRYLLFFNAQVGMMAIKLETSARASNSPRLIHHPQQPHIPRSPALSCAACTA